MINLVELWKHQKELAIKKNRHDLIEVIEGELINLYLENEIYTQSPQSI